VLGGARADRGCTAVLCRGASSRPWPGAVRTSFVRRAHGGSWTSWLSCCAAAGHALLLDCRSGAGTAVPLLPARRRHGTLVIDTRARHALTEAATRHAAGLARSPRPRWACGRCGTSRTTPRALAGWTGGRARPAALSSIRLGEPPVLAAAELLRSGEQAALGALLTGLAPARCATGSRCPGRRPTRQSRRPSDAGAAGAAHDRRRLRRLRRRAGAR
jgi:hypothetical protein